MPNISKVRLDETVYAIKDSASRKSIGKLEDLVTQNRDNLVDAINEIAGSEANSCVRYTEQSLTSDEMRQARDNIGVGSTIADTLIDLKLVTPLSEDDGEALSTADGTILVLGGPETPFVKTINGVKPDEDGNVSIASSAQGGLVTSVNGMTGDVVMEIPDGDWDSLTNKPFYETEFTTSVLDETTLEISQFPGLSNVYGTIDGASITFAPELGEQYVVTVNGVGHQTEAKEVTTGGNILTYLGNMNILASFLSDPIEGEYSDSGESWLYYAMRTPDGSETMYMFITTVEGASVTLAASHHAYTCITLDDRFISDNIARVSDVFSGSWVDLTDRPFGEDVNKGSQIFADENAVYVDYGDFYFAEGTFYNIPTLIAGNTYIVNWDGIDYSCVGYASGSKTVILGNPSIAEAVEDTGEPFYIARMDSGSPAISIVTNETVSSHSLAIFEADIVVRPIDAKFLPKLSDIQDATGETVTAAEFNALLAALRNAGYLAI